MELLIRSQSKFSLVVAVDLVIFKMYDKWLICKLNSSLDISNRIELGTYATQERALEVLDEIQNKICPPNLMNIGFATAIYEMPEE